jgi:hypothetical protein
MRCKFKEIETITNEMIKMNCVYFLFEGIYARE